ncbi:MAG: orotidine-5'-phosphate decarboxylase [Calditrichia bacterium]
MFTERLNKIIRDKKSLLCIGLDTEIERIPAMLLSELDPLFSFNKSIIEATKDYAAAFKLNIAFYESLGFPGWELLEKTLSIMPSDVLVIADAKRADIGNTSKKYAETYFKTYNFDAITVSPFMGLDSVMPFLDFADRGIFILCLTSNSGSQDFQFLKVEDEPLYLKIARKVVEWNFINGNCGLVVGGTHTTEIKSIRDVAAGLPFLVPGIGAQGGNLELAVRYATDERGLSTLINSSRTIVYASAEYDFADVAAERAKHLRDHINMVVRVHKNPDSLDQN